MHGFCRDYHNVNGVHALHTDEYMKTKLMDHEANCYVHKAQRIKFPEEDFVEFTNTGYQVKDPFVAYADFESLLKHLEIDPNANSNKYQEHVACSYAYKIISIVPGVEFEMRRYIGSNAAEHFLESLKHDLYTHIIPLIEKDVEMIFENNAQEQFLAATHCHI